MKCFNLPDLGEGIPEADIVEWRIQEGDQVEEDQIILLVETAKAVVEVPSPTKGKVVKLCGQAGDTILTGSPLLEFESEAGADDAGTVVGSLDTASKIGHEDDNFYIGTPPDTANTESTETGSGVNDLAKKMGISLPAASLNRQKPAKPYELTNPEPLKGVRKHMARTMAESHEQVVPVTLFEDADIDHWKKGEDITVRLIQAVCSACQTEPTLNSWFDPASMSREVFKRVNLGLAVDSKGGLFVPVIQNADQQSAKELRSHVNDYRKAVEERSLPPSDMQGASIILSNFGVFAGRYGTPIVVPPSVCIVGTGRLQEQVVANNGKIEAHRVLPISMTFDHRAVTGGEATRFLQRLVEELSG